MKIIIFAFLLACLSSFGTAFGQLATIPTVQGNNSFSGTNSYTGNSNLKLINTIPQADQFTGADMCLKLQAAISAAYSGGISLVDATHFTGTQTCSVNPLATLSRPLTILLGAVHVQSSGSVDY